MNKKILLAGFLVSVMLFVPINSAYSNIGIQIQNKPINPTSRGNTLYVGGNGSGNYSKIQDAIDNASDGDTVFVYDDNSPYYEHLYIQKSINLIGEDKNTTFIDGNYTDYPINISSVNDVKISGFTLLNPKSPPFNWWESALIKIINCHNSIIENNIVIQNNLEYANWNAGIYLLKSSNNIIRNNIIYNTKKILRSVGIMLDDHAYLNNISNNEIYNFIDGIWIRWLNSYNNTIYENYIYNNSWGIDNLGERTKIINNIIKSNSHTGIEIDVVSTTFVSGNIITYNGRGGEFEEGLDIEGRGSYIINNQISFNNPVGIKLFVDSGNNKIIHNNITNNLQIGLYSDFSEENTVYYNNFIDNGNYNACFEHRVEYGFSIKWDKNYWSNNSGKSFYKIPGYIYVYGLIIFGIPWFNYDWNPASTPYNIPGKSSYFEGCGIV